MSLKSLEEFRNFCMEHPCSDCPYKPFCKIDDKSVQTWKENYFEIIKGIRKEKLEKLLS